MNARKVFKHKKLKIKEKEETKTKRSSQILLGEEKIDPSEYLSYYTLTSVSQRISTKALNSPMIKINNSPNLINRYLRPKQKLVENLLLSKRFKNPNNKKLLSKTIFINNIIDCPSSSSSDLNHKKAINIKSRSNTQTNAKVNTNSNPNSMQTTLTNERNFNTNRTDSQELLMLPKIPEKGSSNISKQNSKRERSNSISSTKSNNTYTKNKSGKNMNYLEYVASMKNRKSSKFSTLRSQNDFDSSYDLNTLENRIVTDFIGKTYESQTADDGYSCFFCSSGNFHCPLFNVFGVVEGNGKHGRQISSLTRSNLHTYLTSGITYGFKTSKASDYEIYESLLRNNYEPVRFVDERIHDDVIKSNLDLETSGVSITIVFIICKKLIVCNVGDVRAVAFLQKKEKGKEILQSKLLSSIDVTRDENNVRVLTNCLGNTSKSFTGVPTCFCTDITEDYSHIIIASNHFWDNMTYGNVFKFMSTIQTDNIISKAEQIMDFKEKQNQLYNRKNMPYSFCLIEL